MALYGKIGDQVVIRENINNLVKQPSFQNQGGFNPNQFPAPQNTNLNSNTKFDYTKCIRVAYHNPASIDLNSNTAMNRTNFLEQLNNIRAPDLSNIPRILEACDTMKVDYNSFLAMNVKLDDFLSKSKASSQNQKSNVYSDLSHLPQNNKMNPFNKDYVANPGSYNSQNIRQQQQKPVESKGYSDYDVQRFVTKFKCAREMAIGYLEAFQNYSEAEQQFIQNTGWKG